MGITMTKDKIISVLESYFQSKAETYDLDVAFLYGSWAGGYPKEESDIDVAVLFSHKMDEDKAFDLVSNLSLELTDLLRHETDVLYIDSELSKPMLHYNAIVHGIPIFIRDFTRYADTKMKAISRMEDFGIFGLKWQSEIVEKRLEALNHA